MTETPEPGGQQQRRRRVLQLTDEELKNLQISNDQIVADLAGHHHHDDSVEEPEPTEPEPTEPEPFPPFE